MFATGQYQWDILISEDSVLTAVGNLIGYNGYSGSINFSTSECHQFLAGAEKKSTTLEVSISVDSKRYTLIQTPCNVFADVISDGVLEPLPLGTAMSEQVANARFVRRDTTQSPTATELNNIWLNLGVSKFGTDVSDALSGSQSPGPANPFATLADIPSVIPAEWGNITGTLSDQTDLQTALDGKYDTSNPAGYLTSADLSTYATQNWVDTDYYPRYNPSGYTTESWVNSQGFITSGYLNGYATESWVISQGYLTSGSIYDMATMSWVNSQNYTTLEAAQDWVNSQGYLSFDTFGRLSFPGGTNPDQYPIPGRFWFQSEKFRYSTSTSSLGNVIASEGWCDAKFQTLAGMSSYLTTANAASTYAQLAGATFTGKINAAPSTTGSAGLNLGSGSAPTTPVQGDIWTAGNTDTLRYRAPLTNQTFDVAVRNATNTFVSPNIIDTTSNTLPALRITQKGTQAALVVEDSLNPDTTATVIDASGNLGVGVDASTWTATNKVEIVGAVKAQSITFDGSAQFKVNSVTSHGTGANTHDLLISFNGSTYRIPMIFVSTP